MMATHSVSISITGSGGAGAMTTGTMLLDAASQAGWYGYMTRSSGAQIRGGEAAAMVRLSTSPINSHDDRYHILVAIDWDNVGRFAAEIPLSADSLVIGDPSEGDFPEQIRAMGAREHGLDLKELARQVEGGRANMVALGVIAGLIGLPEDSIGQVIERTLKRKQEKAISASKAAVHIGIEASAGLPPVPRLQGKAAVEEKWSITGNEAAGLGAIRGGIRFVAAYPITPGTEVLEWLAPNLAKLGGVLVQAEDELASINQIIGGSYGGVPSLTATSGPGLALMTESIGLAIAAEVPIVVVDVMRGGPSTGIPVKSEQSDLNIALYGMHGDAPHVVVAANSVSDCLFTTQWGVYLAEKLQTAAIVLSDQSLGQTRAIIPRPPESSYVAERLIATTPADNEAYKRYRVTDSGVSPMAIPGTVGCQYTADGLEHAESGTPSSSAADHHKQMDKRQNKLTRFDYGDAWADIEGEGDIAVITWGSSMGPSREAVQRLAEKGIQAKMVSIRLLSPAQPEKLAKALAGVRRTLVVEQTHSGQFHHMLRAHYELPGEVRALHKPGPLPIRPNQIVERIVNWG